MSDLWTHIAAIFIGVVITLYIAQKVAEANQAATEAVKQSSSTSTAMVGNPTTRSGGTAASVRRPSVRRPSVRRPSVRRQHYHQYSNSTSNTNNNVINNDNHIHHNHKTTVNNYTFVNNYRAPFTEVGVSLAATTATIEGKKKKKKNNTTVAKMNGLSNPLHPTVHTSIAKKKLSSWSTSTAMVNNPTTRSGGTAASVRRPSVRRQHYHQYNVHNTNNVINNDNRIYHNNNAIVNNNTASFTRAGASLAVAVAVSGSGPGLHPPESVKEETTADPAAGLLPVTSVAVEGEEPPIYHNNNAIVNHNTASFTRAGASLAEAAAVYGSGPGLNPPESVEEETTADPAAGLLPVTSVAAEGEESPSPDEKVTREMVAACEYTRRRGEGLALRRQEWAQARVDAKRVIDQQSCAMRRKKKRLLSQQQQQDKYPSKWDLAGLTNREKKEIFQGYWSKNTEFL